MYVDAVCAAAETGIYDVMAHPDLAKVFGAAAVGRRWATSSATRLAECFARGRGLRRDLERRPAQAGG